MGKNKLCEKVHETESVGMCVCTHQRRDRVIKKKKKKKADRILMTG